MSDAEKKSMARRTTEVCVFCLAIVACAADGAAPDAPHAVTGANAANPAATLYCRLDAAPPQVCRMDIKTGPAATDVTLDFALDSGSVRFKGQHQSAWWSGQLNDKPAMGYELNRGHTIYSTSDLSTTFEWWYGDKEHGNY
jgi:hypothetical protein